MEIIKWRTAYETGIEQMDKQHKQLIQLINQMYTLLRNDTGFEAMASILKEMDEYAANHFKDEEALLETHSFPDLAKQQSSHAAYTEKVTSMLESENIHNQAGARDLYSFLRKWWIDHIIGEDREYGSFLKEKGVK